MKQIELCEITLGNFKTFRQACIQLSGTAGLKFVGGRNLIEPRLGSNGSGKSSLFDGLCWAIYGVGVRGQRASDLVTWGTEQARAAVILRIDGEARRIARTGPPNRLAIDGQVASQEDVERLVGLSRERFLQSVLFGQAMPLFLDLSVPARGELLDSVLELGLWGDLADAAGREAGALTQQVSDLDRKLAFEEGKLAGLEDEAALIERRDRWTEEHEAAMDRMVDQLEFARTQGAEASRKAAKLALVLQGLVDPDVLDQRLQAARGRVAEFERLTASIAFYDGEGCPTCHRPFGDQFSDEQIENLEARVHHLCGGFDDAALREEIATLVAQRTEVLQRRQSLSARIGGLHAEAAHNAQLGKLLAEQAAALDVEANPYTARLETLQAARAAGQAKVAALTAERDRLEGQRLLYDYWKGGFKKLRLYQVRQVLTRMEVETANAATALGIGGWTIRYTTETATKSGTTRQGIQVLISSPGADGRTELYSGGEAQRIRLAVSLGLANLIQNMAGVNFGFEIFDEASQYLSQEGIEDLLRCLSLRAEQTAKSIWVVDHTALAFGAWDEVWQCTKNGNGSHVECVATN